MNHFFEELASCLSELGIKKGDVLYVSSDITKLIYTFIRMQKLKAKEHMEIGIKYLVNSLKKVVGEEGTILIPVFSWEFCRNAIFFESDTKGEVGLLGNWILANDDDFVRTKHPIYSFMVWGKYAEKLSEMKNHDGWDKDSPFGFMDEVGAKNLLIDVTMAESFTYAHYIEKEIGVPYRYIKDFEGMYINKKREKELRVYSMYVRDLDIQSRQISKDEYFIKNGIIKQCYFNNIDLKLIELKKIRNIIEENIKWNQGSDWYVFDEYHYKYGDKPTHEYEIKKMQKIHT